MRVALVSPFVGLLFDGSIVGSHDLVTTPPYDVISDDERRHYLDASPYNVIRLVLGRTTPVRAGRSTSIGRRRPKLETWRARVRSSRPSARRSTRTRCGSRCTAGAARSGAWSARWSSRTGRLDRAARADDARADRGPPPLDARGPDEPVEHPRGVPGPSEPFAAFLDDAMARGPAASTADEAGSSTLWVSEPNQVATWLAPESLMIADGHHRYSMALRYRTRCARSTARARGIA